MSEPLLGETKFMFVDGETAQMVWNGKKWLRYEDIYPLIHYALTGYPVNYGEDGASLLVVSGDTRCGPSARPGGSQPA